MWWYGGPGFWGGWGGGWLMMLLGIGGFFFVLWGIIFLIKWFINGASSHEWHEQSYRRYDYDRNDAITTLKMRYARGEINKEEFEKILRDLRSGV